MIIPPTESEISRFSGKYNIDPVTGCWFTLNGREVKFTPEEIMDALESKP